MKKMLSLLFLSVGLCGCSVNSPTTSIVSKSVDLTNYNYATINYVAAEHGSAALTDLEFKVYDALAATRLKVVGEGQIASLSDAERQQLLTVRVSASNARYATSSDAEYIVVSIDFIDYMTGRPVVSCKGSGAWGMVNDHNVMVAAGKALDEMKKLF